MARRRRSRRTRGRCIACGASMKSGQRWTPMPAGSTSLSPASLSGFATLWMSCRIAGSCARRSPMGAIRTGLSSLSSPTLLTVAVPHRDHGLALWAAAATALSVLACCVFWIATGWADGASAATVRRAVGTSSPASDDPRPAFRSFCGVFLVVIAINGIYTFGRVAADYDVRDVDCRAHAGLPAVRLDGCAARDRSRRFLARHLHIGAIGAAVVIRGRFRFFRQLQRRALAGRCAHRRVMRHRSLARGRWIASRLLRSNWITLGRGRRSASRSRDRVAIASLMQHRLALLAARIAVVPAEARSDAANLRQLRTALSIIDLRQAALACRVPSWRRSTICSPVLLGFPSPQRRPLPDEWIGQLDGTIASTLRESASEASQ